MLINSRFNFLKLFKQITRNSGVFLFVFGALLISCDPDSESKADRNSNAKETPDGENIEIQKNPEFGKEDKSIPIDEPINTPEPDPNPNNDQETAPDADIDPDPDPDPDLDPPAILKGSCAKANDNGWLLCEDFESSTIDTTRWEVRKSGLVNGEIFDGSAFHGKNSLKVTWEKKEGNNYIVFRLEPLNIFPIKENVLFGRAYLYLEGFYTEKSYDYFLDLQTRNVNRLFSLGLSNDGFFSAYIPGASPPFKTEIEKRYKATTMQWLCLEWEFNGLNQEILFWIDGLQLKNLDLNSNIRYNVNNPEYFEMGNLARLGIGLTSRYPYGYSNPVIDKGTIFWDSIVLAKQRVGCE